MTIGVRTKPKPPATVSCSAVVISVENATTAIDVNWPAPPGQGKPVAGFVVYRNGTEIASVSASVRVYRDTGAPYGTSNSYAVVVVSQSSVASAQRGSNATLRQRRPVVSVPASRTVAQGETVDFSQWATDDDTLSYTFTAKPDAGYTINPTTGVGTMGSGSGNLTFRAVDQAGLYASGTMAVTVATAPGPAPIADLQAAGYVVVTASPYNADNTGGSVTTAALQSAIDAAAATCKPVYIPAGTYLVDDTIRLYHWNRWGVNNWKSHHIQGCTTNPPTIKLKASASGFSSATDPRPVINVRAWDALNSSATTEALPTHPLGNPTNYRDASGMVVSTRVHSVHIHTNGNAGAIGLATAVAQQANAAHIKVTATGSFAGIAGTTGTMGFSNIEVIGGRYGLYYPTIRETSFNSGTYVSGFTLTGQTVANIAIADFAPQVFVGGYVEMPSGGSVMRWVTGQSYPLSDTNSNGTQCATPVMIDTVVVAAGDAVAFPSPNRTMYLRNIYVTGTTQLIRSYEGASVITAAGTWKRIVEYSRAGLANDPLGNTDGSYYTYTADPVVNRAPHRAVIDGVRQSTKSYETPTSSAYITPSSSAPPGGNLAFVDLHSHPTLPCIDNGAYCNVTASAFGAKPFLFTYLGSIGDEFYLGAQSSIQYGNYPGPANRPEDAAPAINAAIAEAERLGHNRVFLPRGCYYIGSPINLRPDTRLFGVGSEKTVIAAHYDWLPTSKAYMIQSADSATGTASISDFMVFIRKKWPIGGETVAPGLPDNKGQPTYWYPYDYFCEILWRTGRRSWSHGVDTKTQWANEYWPARERQKWTFTGNGGGRHWYVYSDGRSNCNSSVRVVLVDGTRHPLAFYGTNVEIGKGAEKGYGYDPEACIEIRGASNVRIYGSKREGNAATVWVNGNSAECRNIAIYGCGAQRSWPWVTNNYGLAGTKEHAYEVFTGDIDNLLMAVSTIQMNSYDSNAVRLTLKEAKTGQSVVRVYWPEGVSLYKRGTIDDSVMVFT